MRRVASAAVVLGAAALAVASVGNGSVVATQPVVVIAGSAGSATLDNTTSSTFQVDLAQDVSCAPDLGFSVAGGHPFSLAGSASKSIQLTCPGDAPGIKRCLVHALDTTDDAALAKTLIANGAKVDFTREANGLTPLGVATQNGKKNAAAVLIEAGADVNLAVGQGRYTPLMLATTAGTADTAEKLVGKGANVNAKNPGGVTALMIAAAGNRPDIAKLLMKAGADPNAKSEDGRTALTIAEANSSDAVAKVLREASPKPGKS